MVGCAIVLARRRDIELVLGLLVGRRDWVLDCGGGSLVLVRELRLYGGEKGNNIGLMMVAEWWLKERGWQRWRWMPRGRMTM
jgi:hypothetical protein